MLGQLVPCGGGDPIPLLRKKLLIGRRSRCDITLGFPNVSSHHCELELVNGYWRVKDLGSTNGIKVNGERCDVHWLMPGDELRVAKHSFEVAYEPLGDAPPPESSEIDVFAEGLMEKAGLERPNDDRRSSSGEVHARKPKPPEPSKPNRVAKAETEEAAFQFLTEETPKPRMRTLKDPRTDDS